MRPRLWSKRSPTRRTGGSRVRVRFRCTRNVARSVQHVCILLALSGALGVVCYANDPALILNELSSSILTLLGVIGFVVIDAFLAQ